MPTHRHTLTNTTERLHLTVYSLCPLHFTVYTPRPPPSSGYLCSMPVQRGLFFAPIL